MLILDIFHNSDGTFAWDAVLLLVLAILAGYWLHRFSAKKSDQHKTAAAIVESEAKYKKLENEFKNYKSNINAGEKQNEKSVVQLGGRVKSLEGDIRVLSDEKNKLHQQVLLKDEELKKYGRQIADLDDNLKVLLENKIKSENDAAEKLKVAKEELTRASAWEKRVRAAEEEAEKARSAIGNAERKKLEAELRLKATAEFAGKVGPMEAELKLVKDQLAAAEMELKTKITPSEETLAALRTVSAQLELQKDNNKTLQQEFDMKQAANISLNNEIQYLKTVLSGMTAENEMLKSKMALTINQTDGSLKSDEVEKAV